MCWLHPARTAITNIDQVPARTGAAREGVNVMAHIENSRCVLAVRDLKVSTRYYTDVLGFSQDPIHAEGWSFLTRDNFRVMLGECRDEKPAGELGNHSYFAYWNVDDVDQFYQEIVAKGALVTSP